MATPVARRGRQTSNTSTHLTAVRKLLLENGLSIVLLTLFFLCWLAQAVIGLCAYNKQQKDHDQSPVNLIQYLSGAHFIEATAENWESEFLQMAAFVWFTSFLFQKGSPESRHPHEPPETAPLTKKSPWPVKRGGWVLKLYENSLALAFVFLFLVSFLLHALGGAREYSQDQIEHGRSPVSVAQYLGTSRFWFESFQNWQSEFLAVAAMVLLGIFLRQKGSPESKPVQMPHSENP